MTTKGVHARCGAWRTSTELSDDKSVNQSPILLYAYWIMEKRIKQYGRVSMWLKDN